MMTWSICNFWLHFTTTTFDSLTQKCVYFMFTIDLSDYLVLGSMFLKAHVCVNILAMNWLYSTAEYICFEQFITADCTNWAFWCGWVAPYLNCFRTTTGTWDETDTWKVSLYIPIMRDLFTFLKFSTNLCLWQELCPTSTQNCSFITLHIPFLILFTYHFDSSQPSRIYPVMNFPRVSTPVLTLHVFALFRHISCISI